ncbi:hypothetical protein BS17DRAFT_713407, partial [Gyrodon lividus]
ALGLTYKTIQCTASQRDEQAHQAWCDDIAANFTRNQFAFIDESSKDGRTLIAYLAVYGYLAVRIVKGSVDGAEFYDFIMKEAVS